MAAMAAMAAIGPKQSGEQRLDEELKQFSVLTGNSIVGTSLTRTHTRTLFAHPHSHSLSSHTLSLFLFTRTHTLTLSLQTQTLTLSLSLCTHTQSIFLTLCFSLYHCHSHSFNHSLLRFLSHTLPLISNLRLSHSLILSLSFSHRLLGLFVSIFNHLSIFTYSLLLEAQEDLIRLG